MRGDRIGVTVPPSMTTTKYCRTVRVCSSRMVCVLALRAFVDSAVHTPTMYFSFFRKGPSFPRLNKGEDTTIRTYETEPIDRCPYGTCTPSQTNVPYSLLLGHRQENKVRSRFLSGADKGNDGADPNRNEEGSYEHLGCFKDNKEDRVLGNVLKSPQMTPKVCNDYPYDIHICQQQYSIV